MSKRQKFFMVRSLVLGVLLSSALGKQALAQNNNAWTQEFVGQLTFTLMDDPDYKRDYESMIAVEQELQRIRMMLADKRAQLENANNEKLQSVAQLEQTQFSLSEKIDLRDKTELEIESLENQLEAIINLIAGNISEINVKQNELDLLNDQIDLVQADFDSAVLSEQSKKTQYDTLLAQCIQDRPGEDCTADKDVVYAMEMWQQAVERKKFLENQLSGLTNLANDAESVIDEKTAQNAVKQQEKTTTEQTIVTKSGLVETLKSEIPQLQALSSKLTSDIDELSTLITVLIEDEQRLSDLDAVNALNFERADAQFKRLEQDLIASILEANKNGIASANGHGQMEGLEASNTLGNQEGTKDGSAVGEAEGEADGRSRDYEIGAKEGAVEGETDGSNDGKKDGEAAGQIEGNRIAGFKIGEKDGINRANNDQNAVTQGTSEGIAAGIERAKADGRARGRKLGEQESIEKNENINLNQVLANGSGKSLAFGATFSGGVPTLDEVSNAYYNDQVESDKQVIRLAYTAGYSASYANAVFVAFNANISNVYNQAFASAKDQAYQASYGVTYTDSIRQGRLETYQRTYDQFYSQTRTTTFNNTRDVTISNPDRNSVAFLNSYTKTEQASYQQRFAERKEEAKKVASKKAYDSNIGPETQKNRVARIAEVDKIYQNFPVLKFVSTSVKDLGQNGVGQDDKVFQPGESVGMDMTIINYGKTSAKNVIVKTNSGHDVALPEIPGASTVFINNAVIEQISRDAKLGSSKSIKTTTIHELKSTEKAIEGKYFASTAANILDNKNTQTVSINNPFEVQVIALESALVLGKEASLSLSLKNKSKKAYQGPIDVKVTTSLGSSIVTSEFEKLTSAATNSTVKVSGAKVKVDNSQEIFSEVDFSIEVSKNGVVLATAKKIGETIVQMPYVEKSGAPVIAISSKLRDSRQLFKDVASELGGADQVSVLDLNNNDANARTLKKIKGKTVFVIGNKDEQVESQMNDLFTDNNNVVVTIKDLSSNGTLNRLKRLKALNKASTLSINIDGKTLSVLTTNKFADSAVKNRVSAVSVESTQIESIKKVTELLKLSNNELLDRAAKVVSVEALLNRESQAVNVSKMIIARLIEEVIQVDSTCSSRKECRQAKKFVKNDSATFANQIITELENNTEKAKGVMLLGDAIEDVIMSFAKKDNVKYLSLRGAVKKKAKEIRKLANKIARKEIGKAALKQISKNTQSVTPIRVYSLKD